MKLLPENMLVKTSSIDEAKWNYQGMLRRIQRRRFQVVCQLLGDRGFDHLLEIGYGSGIFLPELSTRTDRLSGVDVHPHAKAVSQQLAALDVEADLHQGSAAALPFQDSQFDGIVSVSALEFVDDLSAAAAELARVLQPGGLLVVVSPAKSWASDFALRVLKGQNANRIYGQGRENLYPALGAHFEPIEQIEFPALAATLGLKLYHARALTPRTD